MIKYAILGLLSWKPLTGYDLKQIFRSSLTMYWSGGNNQIYRMLVKLHDEELVTREIENSDSGPSRKIYTITSAGEDELREWVLSQPDVPEIKNEFLIRMAWADQLSNEELDGLLARYKEEVNYRWIMQHEFMEREADKQPNRTAREKLLWDSINKNWIMTFEREMAWVQTLRDDLKALSTVKKKPKSPAKPYKFDLGI
ncbi:MAG: hypothetical protein Phog2KO_50370 [Phototrophicaceae bacterium]